MKMVFALVRVRICLLAAMVLFPACARPKQETATAGDLRIGVAVEPDPPRAGDNRVRLTITDAAGQPVEGARIAFEYDMAAMGNMPEMKGGGDVESLSGGRYEVSYNLSMNGDWSLRVGVDAAGHGHQAVGLRISPPHRGFSLDGAQGDGTGLDSGSVIEVSAERRQLIGATFAAAEERPLTIKVRAVGRVDADPRKGRVWVQAAISERDATLVSVGQPARVSLPRYPAETVEARVTFVAPAVDEKNRIVAARLELLNSRSLLRPGMSVDVEISVPLGGKLAVPDSALLLSGEHRYVFVDRGGGKLRPTEVQVGAMTGGWDEIRSGLRKGDRVATGATFLLSSEAKLQGALPGWGDGP